MAWREYDFSGASKRVQRVAIIGFGTRGRCLARSLLRRGFDVAVFDRAFQRFESRPARAVSRMEVTEHASIAGVIANSALVLVAAPADAAVEIARSAADHLDPGCLYVDATACDQKAAEKARRALGLAATDYIPIDSHDLIERAQGLLTRADVAVLRRDLTAKPKAGYGHRTDIVRPRLNPPGAVILPFVSPVREAARLPHEAAA